MIKVALYFGSFNPIHNGHIGLAKHVLCTKDIDELWFVVTPQNPLKDTRKLIPDAIRIKMATLAVRKEERTKVCDVEMYLPKPNYTINTLEYLTEKYPYHTFTLIIGADNMDIFDKWKDYDKILRGYKVLVYPRNNAQTSSLQFPQMEILEDAPLFNVSSTEIREKTKEGSDIDDLVPKAVYAYIKENNLYK